MKLRRQVTRTRNVDKWFLRYASGPRQTNAQTDTLMTILSIAAWAK